MVLKSYYKKKYSAHLKNGRPINQVPVASRHSHNEIRNETRNDKLNSYKGNSLQTLLSKHLNYIKGVLNLTSYLNFAPFLYFLVGNSDFVSDIYRGLRIEWGRRHEVILY